MQLQWLLDATIALFPVLQAQLDAIIATVIFTAAELPQPAAQERKAPRQKDEPGMDLTFGY